jgi:hypothetical protein
MVAATGACREDAESNRAETGPCIEVGFANDSLFGVTGAFDEAATGPCVDLESENDSLLAVTGACEEDDSDSNGAATGNCCDDSVPEAGFFI